MDHAPLHILLVEDNPGDARLVELFLAEAAGPATEVLHATTLAEARRLYDAGGIDLVLLDLCLPDSCGMETVDAFVDGGVPVVVLSGTGDEATALEALRRGAEESLSKSGLEGPALLRVLRHAVERRRHVHLLRASEREAWEAIRLRDEVLGVVAHDLRTPLTAIVAYASLMQERVKPEEAHDHAAAILRLATQMDGLIQDLLTVSRIRAGRLPLQLAAAAPGTLVREAVQALELTARQRGVSLQTEIEPGLPPVLADGERMRRVFANVAGNAVKFTPAGGTVRVRAGAAAEGVRFSVADTGPGIPAEELPHVFERFWQSPSESAGGTGLGLAIAKALVERHGGSLEVRSRPGEGSTFSFVLPTAAEAASRTALHPPRAPPHTPHRAPPVSAGPRRG